MYKIIKINSEIKTGVKIYTVVVKFDDCIEFTVFTFPKLKMTYDSLVNEFVKLRYPNDVMQAIINNYLLDNDSEEVVTEFNMMQEWRKVSKQLAKDILSKIA